MKHNPYKVISVGVALVGISVATLLLLQRDGASYINYPTFTSSAKQNVAGNDSKIQYVHIPAHNPNYTYPIIAQYKNIAVMQRVNTSLMDAFKDSGCDDDTPEITPNEWNVTNTVVYAENNIFSVNEHGNYYCGTAYPTNNYSYTRTFDMQNGEEVSFQQLFKNYEQDRDEILTTIYGNIIAQADTYNTAYPTESADDAGCSGVNTLEMLSAYLHDYQPISDKHALLVRPGYPHVIEACIEEATVPIEKLLPFTAEDSILRRM